MEPCNMERTTSRVVRNSLFSGRVCGTDRQIQTVRFVNSSIRPRREHQPWSDCLDGLIDRSDGYLSFISWFSDCFSSPRSAVHLNYVSIFTDTLYDKQTAALCFLLRKAWANNLLGRESVKKYRKLSGLKFCFELCNCASYFTSTQMSILPARLRPATLR